MLIRFILGALIYMGIEVMYDGTSARSMGLVGGLSFVLCGGLVDWLQWPYVANMFLIGTIVTILEYIGGRIFNRDFKIWDYRKFKYNLNGQICLEFFLLWCLVISHVIMYLHDKFVPIWP